MTFLSWVLAGVVTGLVGGLVVSGFKQRKFTADILIALVGAFVGGLVFAPIAGLQIVNQPDFDVRTMLIGFAGAVVVLAAYYFVRRMRTSKA
jgi:uncharacterized membrane protein YeaQ/YmgE (transglycosylase-associated protein family)